MAEDVYPLGGSTPHDNVCLLNASWCKALSQPSFFHLALRTLDTTVMLDSQIRRLLGVSCCFSTSIKPPPTIYHLEGFALYIAVLVDHPDTGLLETIQTKPCCVAPAHKTRTSQPKASLRHGSTTQQCRCQPAAPGSSKERAGLLLHP